jgi:hypothetical protein
VGVNVTLSDGEPAPGAVDGKVQAKVPATEAVPPVRAELASVCPTTIGLAVGHVAKVGVALFTATVTVPVTEL